MPHALQKSFPPNPDLHQAQLGKDLQFYHDCTSAHSSTTSGVMLPSNVYFLQVHFPQNTPVLKELFETYTVFLNMDRAELQFRQSQNQTLGDSLPFCTLLCHPNPFRGWKVE
jgi:hypothetical protein